VKSVGAWEWGLQRGGRRRTREWGRGGERTGGNGKVKKAAEGEEKGREWGKKRG